jgi:tRNA pseudouridine38-40 synthase
MPQRLKLIVSYDGGRFAGWQSQKHGNTVQDRLERAFRQITGSVVRVHGAGRTDAGVHALAQCAHADVGEDKLPTARWISALNANLPPELRVIRCQRVAHDFHARFSAIGKVYRYRIWTGPILPPLDYGRVWHLPRQLDSAAFKTAAAMFVGRHDFAGFAANRGHRERDTIRTIHSVKVRQYGFSYAIEFSGDGFLYRMVRLMTGGVTDCALGKITIDQLVARLETRGQTATRLAAPAEGLYLIRVRY